ncbi:MAG: ExbD/TolR family protein [Candidatus Nitrohelix vancouverensis]|uniref:ExbD/TolR family protein n=1 Tax=Candidatus Nitrohelix vancouverensis TaxID=2705534 RepID=A0A7T0BZV1_9BACT|nr:MAG: ExbD/TolR family protein [Candidatus Nitrohelix vancouverensis]
MMRKRRPLMAEINVTPFVDVMLVLLVIFMITAPLMKHGMEVQLPEESIAPIKSKPVPTVTVKSNKRMFWDEEEIDSLQGLTERAKTYHAENEKGEIYLRADKMLDYGFVMHVLATIKRAGVLNIGMVTEPSEG